MWLPDWLYKLMPAIYAVVAVVGFWVTAPQPLGASSAGLLILVTAYIAYARASFREESARRHRRR